jgi:hypothetical protein
VYRGVEEELFRAIADGKTVAFADAADHTTSADVPLTEVGNLEYSGCSPKYLDGIITGLRVNGKEYANGATIEVPEGDHIILQISLQNTTGSTWLCKGNGAVSLVANDGSFTASIPSNMAKRDRVTLTVELGDFSGHIQAYLMAAGRGIFGDRLDIQIRRG